MADFTYDGTDEELRAKLARLPEALAGQVPGCVRAAEAVARALGVEALACAREAFVEKSRGGTGSDGITWAPLSRKYVAYGRRHPGLNSKRSRAGKAGRARRPLLTAKLDAVWRAVYASALRSGKDGGTAAALAWGVVKRKGGKTILAEYGGAQVAINIDTGRLLASLGPGAPGNVLRAVGGAVTIGTNVAYADHVHARRPIFPPEGQLPDAWRVRLEAVLAAALPQFLSAFLAA